MFVAIFTYIISTLTAYMQWSMLQSCTTLATKDVFEALCVMSISLAEYVSILNKSLKKGSSCIHEP